VPFSPSVCVTVSNALLQSSTNTRANSCVVNMEKMVWMSVIRAASVEPVGLNANWSAKCSPDGGC